MNSNAITTFAAVRFASLTLGPLASLVTFLPDPSGASFVYAAGLSVAVFVACTLVLRDQKTRPAMVPNVSGKILDQTQTSILVKLQAITFWLGLFITVGCIQNMPLTAAAVVALFFITWSTCESLRGQPAKIRD